MGVTIHDHGGLDDPRSWTRPRRCYAQSASNVGGRIARMIFQRAVHLKLISFMKRLAIYLA